MPDAAYYNWNLVNNRAAAALGYGSSGPLSPEEMDSFEINLSQVMTETLKLEMNLFYNMFKDQLSWGALENVWTGDEVEAINAYNNVGWGGGMFQNSQEEFDVYGTEIMGHWQVKDRLRMTLSYGFSEIEDDIVVRRQSEHQVKWNATSFHLDNRLTASLSYLFASGFDEDQAPGHHPVYGDDRHLADLALTYRVLQNARLKVVVQNAFGEDVPAPTFAMESANQGNAGADETRVYLSCNLDF